MTTETPPLRWSTQLSVTPIATSLHLQGDKICLPQSALEQLLSAVTVDVAGPASSQPYTSTFDPYNPYSYAAERQARAQVIERQQQLPHPLTFRLVNPTNGLAVYAGIREFSAEESEVVISPFLRQALGIGDVKPLARRDDGLQGIKATGENGKAAQEEDKKAARVTVHAQQLPKGTYVRFRPLEAGYDVEDWKCLLERYLRDNFTTLTNGEILTIPAGDEEFRFLVDKLAPEAEGICIVDTDLEVDIEALNEEQARETLKRRLKKIQRAPGTKEGSSAGGQIKVGTEETGQVRVGEYVDYELDHWDRTMGLQIDLVGLESTEDLDLFVNPLGPKQRGRPREEAFVFGEISNRPSKRLRIDHTHVELDHAEAIWVSVHGYSASEDGELSSGVAAPLRYRLQITSPRSLSSSEEEKMPSADVPSGLDEVRCKNCHQWVPKRTMMLHENFCLRNNILCPHCEHVFKKSSSEWQDHWHCPHDTSYGDTISSRTKHNHLLHEARRCHKCNYSATNTPDLAHHSTTTCPGKLILCQFCHLQVPQQGPDDPDASDPEVLFSGLTPHELADGARTTECHLCSKIVRLRDMSTHLKHHDFERLSRLRPRICRNVNCGRTLDGVGKNGEIKRPQPSRNDLGLCDTCFGPLYVSMYDPEGKALKRRVERKYLTQLLTGCGKDWCRNEYCKSGRKYLGLEATGSKEALAMVKPFLDKLVDTGNPLHFCTDEASQKRRTLAEMIAAEGRSSDVGKHWEGSTTGYDLAWCVASLEAEGGDLDRARAWLKGWAPTMTEEGR